MKRKRLVIFALVLAFALLASACGAPPTEEPPEEEPLRIMIRYQGRREDAQIQATVVVSPTADFSEVLSSTGGRTTAEGNDTQFFERGSVREGDTLYLRLYDVFELTEDASAPAALEEGALVYPTEGEEPWFSVKALEITELSEASFRVDLTLDTVSGILPRFAAIYVGGREYYNDLSTLFFEGDHFHGGRYSYTVFAKDEAELQNATLEVRGAMIPTADVGVEASIEGDYKLVVLPVEAGLSAYGMGPIPVDTPVPGALPELYGEYAAELWPREEIRELSVITARRLSGLVLTPADETETEDLLALLYPGLEAFTREAELPVGVGLTGVELLLGNGEDSTPIQILEGGGEQYLLVGLGSKQQTYSAPRGTLELEAIGELTRAVLRRSGSSWTQH